MLASLEHIVCMDNLDPTSDSELLQKADACGLKIFPFDEVLAKGQECLASFSGNEPKPDDMCMFSYTSGTTGNPKGVQLSQSNLLYSAVSVNLRAKHLGFTDQDSHLSYLPLAHSFEQVLFATCITYGT